MKLLTVDGNSLLNRAYYGIRLLSNKEGIFTNGIMGFLNMLLKVQEEVNPDAIAIAFDMKGPTFRHDMYDDYKAGRSPMPDELAMQMPLLQELLTYLGYTIVKKESYEADDIIGTLSASCKKQGNQCVIATGDRDSFQLVGDGVTVHLAYTKRGQTQEDIVDTQFIRDEYGIEPSQLLDVKALMGDSSDNIPGVKGVGEKTALMLIQQYETLDYIYENFDDLKLTPAQRRNLEAGKDIAYLSRELAEIDCNVPIETDISHYKKEAPDNTKAYPLMARLELFAQMERLGVEQPSNAEMGKAKADLEIIFGGIPKEKLEKESLDVLFTLQDNHITSLCVIDKGEIYYQEENLEEKAREIFESDTPKRTNNLKPLWHWAIENDTVINNVVLDAEIAAYILNPNANDYYLKRLYGEYSVMPPLLDEEKIEKYPLLEDAVGFTKLCDILQQKLEENDQTSLLKDIELPLAEVLASMEHIGIAVDKEGIEEFGKGLEKTLAKSEENIYKHAGEEFNINSPKQLSEILFDEDKLGLPPKRKTKTGYSTDAEVLDSLKDDHPIINDILDYRQLAKLKSTYVDGLLAVINPEDGRIHTTFQQTLTRTGRISSTEPNLQNIPIRTPLGSELRRFFIAGEGYSFLDADYSQIELRVLAHLSKDENMINAFNNDEDIHSATAAQVFDMPPQMVTPLMRNRAKAVNFGIVYGIGAFSLSQDIGVTVKEADDYIKGYLRHYSGVDKYMQDVIAQGTEMGYVSTMYNRRRYLPELASSNYQTREFGKRVARNTPIQGSAADIIKIAMVKVYHKFKKEKMQSRLILQVHDELMVESPPHEVEKASAILREEMETATKLLVPLIADVQVGDNWLEV